MTVRVSFYILWNSVSDQPITDSTHGIRNIPVDYALLILLFILTPKFSHGLIWASTICMAVPMGVISLDKISELQEEAQEKSLTRSSRNDSTHDDNRYNLSKILLSIHETYNQKVNQRLETFFVALWNNRWIFSFFRLSRVVYRVYCIFVIRTIHVGSLSFYLDVYLLSNMVQDFWISSGRPTEGACPATSNSGETRRDSQREEAHQKVD
jgi:hypothetical protein